MTRHLLSPPAALLVTLALSTPALLLTASPAAAQDVERLDEGGEEELEVDESPFRIDLLDVTARSSDSKSARARILDLLDRAEGLDLRDGAFSGGADAAGLDTDELRSGDGRDAARDRMGKILAENDLEALIIIDAYKGGRFLQLIVIGPGGDKLHESKQKVRRRRRLGESEAKEILRDAFAVTIPALKEHREELAREEKRRREEEERKRREAERLAREQEAQEQNGDLYAEAETKRQRGEGPLATTIALGAGPFLGRRTFQLLNDAVDINQQTPLLGVGVNLRAAKGLLDDNLHVGVDGDFAWAPFKVAYTDAAGDEQILASNFVRGGGALRVAYAVHSMVTIGAKLGADVLSITTAPNPTYTGHRYIWARAGGELAIMPTAGVTVMAEGAALPVLQALTSGDAYGDSEGGLTYEVGGGVSVALPAGVDIALRYRFTPINLTYTIPEGQSTVPQTSDVMHTGMILAGYAF